MCVRGAITIGSNICSAGRLCRNVKLVLRSAVYGLLHLRGNSWYYENMFPESSGLGWFSRYNDSLRAGRSGVRIPVRNRFSAPVPNCPGAHPASCTMGTCFLSLGIKRRGRGFDYPPASNSEVKERVHVYMFRLSGSSWLLLG
jgi:hypothetical protein